MRVHPSRRCCGQDGGRSGDEWVPVLIGCMQGQRLTTVRGLGRSPAHWGNHDSGAWPRLSVSVLGLLGQSSAVLVENWVSQSWDDPEQTCGITPIQWTVQCLAADSGSSALCRCWLKVTVIPSGSGIVCKSSGYSNSRQALPRVKMAGGL